MTKLRKFAIYLILALCVLAIGAAVMLALGQSKISVPTTLDEFTLSDLWEQSVAATGVQESTAQLSSLWLRIEADDSVNLRSLAFRGENEEGQPTIYLVSTNLSGEISWYSSETEEVTTTIHPESVFEEIDQLGLSDVPQGDDGCNLRISFESGGTSYYSSNLTIYQLDDGQLLQLEKISLSSDLPWAKIIVSPMYIAEEGVDETGRTFKRSSTYLGGQCMQQLWFLASEMSKVTYIEYLAD